jgi:hypothetical protein
MGLITKTTNSFNERRFLIRSLVVIFLIQFASTGAQLSNCFQISNNSTDKEKSNLICNQANSSFAETSKLALTTLLALLVPAATIGSSTTETTPRRKKPAEDPENPA